MDMTKSLRNGRASDVAGRSANMDMKLDSRENSRQDQSFALPVYFLRDSSPTTRAASQPGLVEVEFV